MARGIKPWKSTLPDPELVPQYRGIWTAGVKYEISDIVLYNNGLYISHASQNNDSPTNLVKWKVVTNSTELNAVINNTATTVDGLAGAIQAYNVELDKMTASRGEIDREFEALRSAAGVKAIGREPTIGDASGIYRFNNQDINWDGTQITAITPALATASQMNNSNLSDLTTKGAASGYQFVDGSRWYWAATGTANGGTTVAAVDGGYWHREYSGAVSVKWFGAKGDFSPGNLSADDTAAFEQAASVSTNIFIPAGRYRLTKPVRFGVNTAGDGVPFYVVKGEGPKQTKIVGDWVEAQHAGSGVFEFGSPDIHGNEGHRLEGVSLYTTGNCGLFAYGVTFFNAVTMGMSNCVIQARNALNLCRSGGYGYFYTNASISNCTLYCKYQVNYGWETYLGQDAEGFCVNNVWGAANHRWDSVSFSNSATNGPVRAAGTLVKFDSHQFYNEFHKHWDYSFLQGIGTAPYDSSFIELRTYCLLFTEGSVVLNQCNFEVFHTAVVIGSYNGVTDGASFIECNFNGVAHANHTEAGSIGILFYSGGTGYTRNVSLSKCIFEMIQFGDIVVDTIGLNQNGIELFDDFEMVGCSTRESPFSMERTEPFSMNGNTITFSDDRLSKQFKGQSATIKLQALSNNANGYRDVVGEPIYANVIGFPDDKTILLDTSAVIEDGQYSRITNEPTRRIINGNANKGQLKGKFNYTTAPKRALYMVGDILANKAPNAGDVAEYICTTPGKYSYATGNIIKDQQIIWDFTPYGSFTSGDIIQGVGLQEGTIITGMSDGIVYISKPIVTGGSNVPFTSEAVLKASKLVSN